MKAIHFFFAIALLFFACARKEQQEPLFSLQEQTGVDFSNNIHNTKDFNIFSYRNFYNGGGVAIGDLNNDGLSDVFFTANMGANKLYLNKGNWQFEDVTQKAGIRNEGKWGTGVVLVDVDSDGWLDIYVCNAGYQKGVSNENELYHNNRNGTFTEVARQYGLAESGYTTHAAFFDYDLDGDLDCYILKNSFIPVNTLNYANRRELRSEDWPVEDFLKGGGDKLLRNDQGHYTDVSKEANIFGSLIGFGLGVTVGDVNGDLYPDIYVSNDFFERDYLYINQQDGTFKEDIEQCMEHISLSSMGADIADVNNDGRPDIFTTDMLPYDDHRLKTTSSYESIDIKNLKTSSGFYNQYMQNTLQVNKGNGHFVETAFYSGVAASDWSWGGLIFDADNDGFSDLFVCNGIYHDVTDQDFIEFFANDILQKMVMTGEKEEVNAIINKMPSRPIANKMFRNRGELKFADQTTSWGLDQPSFSNGAAYGDLDNDGDLDLVVNNVNQKAFIYRNNSREQKGGHYIGFRLRGRSPNTFAIGTTVRVFQKDQVLSREVMPSRGFQSSVDYQMIIGLGKSNVDSVQIVWPNQTATTILQPPIDQVHRLDQTGREPRLQSQPETALSLFAQAKTPFEKHSEDPFVDFYYERGLPMMLSHEGPRAATGDVNGDGLIDVFIGGAARQAGQLYVQKANGFIKTKQPALESTANHEGVAATWFDCDNDHDLDLFLATGGNRFPAGDSSYQHLLYRNDGNGKLSLAHEALPFSGTNASCVVAADLDGDGDLDLFVGGRSVPHNYGLPPKSAVLLNNGAGHFTEAGPAYAVVANAGFVTDAVWTDVDNDQMSELVVVGEWMAPRIFKTGRNGAKEWSTSLSDLNGWWKSVAAADMDGDGDADLVLGNLGENFYLLPDATHPVKMFVKDFDGNGSVEKLITRTIQNKDKPVFLKKDLVDQIASLRKQNLRHADYADKSVQDLFTPEQWKGVRTYAFNYPSSCIAWNEGKGKFTVQKLPVAVQLSSLNAVLCVDVNGDGKLDLITGGNQLNFLPQFSQLDANNGLVLLNNGQRNFVPLQHSGIDLRGEVKQVVPLMLKKEQSFLFLVNDSLPRLYRLLPKVKERK